MAKSKQVSAIISPTTLARSAILPRVLLEDKAVLLIAHENSGTRPLLVFSKLPHGESGYSGNGGRPLR